MNKVFFSKICVTNRFGVLHPNIRIIGAVDGTVHSYTRRFVVTEENYKGSSFFKELILLVKCIFLSLLGMAEPALTRKILIIFTVIYSAIECR